MTMNILNYELTQWRNKYAPKVRKDLILPQSIHDMVDNFMKPDKNGRLNNIPHFLFVGNAGMGKTNLMKIILDELHPSMKFINGSKDAKIDNLRVEINNWVMTKNFNPLSKTDFKIIFIDEIGNSSQAFQKGIRSFAEAHEHNIRFFMTSNKLDLHEALESRFASGKVNFNEEYAKLSSQDFKLLKVNGYKRLKHILESEKTINKTPLKWDNKALANILNQHFPDIRKCINVLNKSAIMYNGTVTMENSSIDFNTLIELVTKGVPKDLFDFIELQTDLTIYFYQLMEYILKSDTYNNEKKAEMGLIITEYEHRDVISRNKKSNFFRMLLLISKVIR